jgi:hypothetical protein
MNSLIGYPEDKFIAYKKALSFFLGLSNLFSENEIPFIHYRITENLFCEIFNAKNISRKDYVVDAEFNGFGVAIKTFIQDNSLSFQKISEFNKEMPIYKDLFGLDLARKISYLRNIRIAFVKRELGVENLVFHLITRKANEALLYEEPIDLINTDNISVISENDSVLIFQTKEKSYKFLKSKSTLYQQFNLNNNFDKIPVEILDNPIGSVKEFIDFVEKKNQKKQVDRLELPLYSFRKGKPFIFGKSGLNQWNASGRKRNLNEVYIPYPVSIKNQSPNFFPPIEKKWDLELPNGRVIKMKVCQEDGKALMSDPNKDLGQWLLRELLNLKEGELLTYEKILEIGISKITFIKAENKYKLLIE